MKILFYNDSYRDGGSQSWLDENGVEYVQYLGLPQGELYGKWFVGHPGNKPATPLSDEVVLSFVFKIDYRKHKRVRDGL